MQLSKLRLVVVLAAVSVVATSCYTISGGYTFNEDGSVFVEADYTFDSALVEVLSLESSSAEAACEQLVDEVRGDGGLPVSSTPAGSEAVTTHEILPDGSCAIGGRGLISADDVAEEGDVAFTIADDGWTVVMSVPSDAFEGADTEDDPLGLLEKVSVSMFIELPGTPTDDHNAHRVEGSRFIWEATGSDVANFPSELRASSSKSSSGFPWVIPVVIGGFILLVAISAVIRRHKDEASEAAMDEMPATLPADEVSDPASDDSPE